MLYNSGIVFELVFEDDLNMREVLVAKLNTNSNTES